MRQAERSTDCRFTMPPPLAAVTLALGEGAESCAPGATSLALLRVAIASTDARSLSLGTRYSCEHASLQQQRLQLHLPSLQMPDVPGQRPQAGRLNLLRYFQVPCPSGCPARKKVSVQARRRGWS